MNNEVLLELKNISKFFKLTKEKDFIAVKNVSFSLQEGECLGIVGESGCGKTTLARMIVGIEKISSGEILLEGNSIKNISGTINRKEQKKIQMIFQSPISSFSPRMLIENYLWEPLRNYEKLSKKEALPRIKEALKLVSLGEDSLKKYPHEFSGGQLQRIAIARATIIKPKIIICDEATSALDVTIQKQILDLLEELRKSLKISYIFIGHDLATVQKISQRIIVMNSGEIVEVLESKDLKNKARHPYTKTLLNAVFNVQRENKERFYESN